MLHHFYFLLLLLLLLNPHPTTSTTHCTTTTASSKTIQKCTSLPTQSASFAWTYHQHNSSLQVTFTGSFISPTGWVAFGINPTTAEMTGTRALIAFPDPNTGQIIVLPYILYPTVKLQSSPLLSRPLDVHLVSSQVTMYGGKMATVHDGATVEISAVIKLPKNKTRIHLVWNRGLYVQGYSPTIHPTTISDLSSVATLDVLSGSAMGGSRDNIKTLKVVHGILNAIAWGGLLPTGIVASRYLRHIQTLGPAWFYAHAGIQLTAFVLGTTGFAIGIRLGELSPGKAYGLHRKLGFAALVLASLQTLALLFRPKTTNKYRKYWKSYHHFVGYACTVIGVVNVFQGFEVMGLGLSYQKLAYCLFLSTLVGVCIALEVNSWVVFCRKAKEEKLKRDEVVSGVGSQKGSGLRCSLD